MGKNYRTERSRGQMEVRRHNICIFKRDKNNGSKDLWVVNF